MYIYSTKALTLFLEINALQTIDSRRYSKKEIPWIKCHISNRIVLVQSHR